MFVCGNPTLFPEPGCEDCPLVTLTVPSGVALYPGPEIVILYVQDRSSVPSECLGCVVHLVDAVGYSAEKDEWNHES